MSTSLNKHTECRADAYGHHTICVRASFARRSTAVLKIEINDTAICRAFQGIEQALTDTSGLMNDLGDSLLASTTKRFKAGMTPEGTPFVPRSPVTPGRYGKAGDRYGKKPLWRSGDLYCKIHMQAKKDAATIGSNAIQAAMMQSGGRKAEYPNLWGDIPARPFIGFSDEDRGDVLEIIDEWLQRAAGSPG
ncbi:phage virion morphogenesis protein [Paracoccus pantotrophus]|nr:phage virion morphogenesis protein [Paracoccus pantotrophus]